VWSYEVVVGSEAFQNLLGRLHPLEVAHDLLGFTHCVMEKYGSGL